jgi:type I restriction enzyme S subunit
VKSEGRMTNTEWPVVSLFDFCNPKQWPTIPQTAFVEHGYPVYGANGQIGRYTEFNHENPTVLITCRGATCGTINVCEPKSYVTGNAMALDDLDESRVSAEYLVYALRSGSLAQAISGTAQPQITRQSLTAISIPLPPLAEQRRIAEVLDKAEALRAKRRAALAELDSLTQSLFLDLFGDPISNPKKWSPVRFEDICERVTVGIVVKPASYYVSEGVPALRSLNIKPGKIVLQDLVYFSKSDNETKLIKTQLKTGDLVLVRSGQPGTAAVVPRELDGVNAIDLLIATPLPKLIDVTFLCEFFNSAGGRDLVLSKQRGQVQKHLNVGSLNQAIIPLPPITLQLEFARRVTAVEKLKTAQRASLAELDALFATLQHRAFQGEL